MQSVFPMTVLPEDDRSSLYVYKYKLYKNTDETPDHPRLGIPLEDNIVYTYSPLLDECENYDYMGEVPFIAHLTKHVCFTGQQLYISDYLKAQLISDITPKIISRFIWDMHKSSHCFWTPNIALNQNVDIQHNFLHDAFINIYKKSLSESLSTDIYQLQDYIVKTTKSVFLPFYLANQRDKSDMELVYIPIMKAATCPSLLTSQALCSGILEYTRILLFDETL